MERRKILVIDDEKHIRLILESELEDEGYDVITVDYTNKLLETIEKEKPDLITLDIKLGKNSNGREIDGLDVLQEIRHKFYNLPIILCTAYDSFKGDLKAFAADYFVLKSFDFTELKKVSKDLLKLKSLMRQKSEKRKKESYIQFGKIYLLKPLIRLEIQSLHSKQICKP